MDGLPSSHFEDSKALYPPGFENSSIDLDPGFRRIDPTGVAQFDDDLRLRSDSPALGHGVVLAEPDVGIDDPFAPEGNPDIGCFAAAPTRPARRRRRPPVLPGVGRGLS